MKKEIYELMTSATKDQMQLWNLQSRDFQWQIDQLGILAQENEFVKNLVKISLGKNKNHAKRTKGRLFLARNDFMVNQKDNLPKQIEINLIATSIGLQSDGIRRAHEVLNILTKEVHGSPKGLKCIQNFADAVGVAHSFYSNKDSIFVIVIDDATANVLDMEAMVQPLADKGIITRFYTFADILEMGTLDSESGIFTILDEEVAIFYLRTGYNPEQYTDQFWECRGRMENSNSIVCPDIDAQITNLKYMQGLLNKRSTWSRFGLNEEQFNTSDKTTVRIFTFDKDFKNDKSEMIKFIEENGGLGDFVLKPCREGGGNNFFDNTIKDKIDSSSKDELGSYILMERIFPVEEIGIFTDFENVAVGPIVSEIGIYCSGVWNPAGEMVHEQVGDIAVRSRESKYNEGPVIVGVGFNNTFSLF